ncbi:alpha/beta hydrolase [Pleurocapsales cyanobacterium LEGE 10410]|nr:alpha/beta hydrolase [Pleurocapsales cyanobacterium LEGE 10410]
MFFPQNIKSRLVSLALSVSAVLFPVVATAAERIAFSFPPFGQFYIKVDDLEAFVFQGEISAELAYYLNRLPPQQVAKLPELLSTPIEFNPLSIAKFSNSTTGEAVIKNLGKGIRADIDLNGFYALRGAIIAASFDREGFTVINLLREFPLETVYVDLKVLEQYIKRREALLKNRQAIDAAFFSSQPASDQENVKSNLEQLQVQGEYTWYKKTLNYHNPRRPTKGYFDLYLPEMAQQVPLVVVSHGLGSNRRTFAYLAEHLVSHGFAVAVIEHNEISFDRFDNFLSGLDRFPEPNNLIDRPLDVKYVLDRLENESKVNLQQVGVIGQSFGGYTSLTLAGGELIADDTAAECQINNYRDVLLDLSSLAKCTFNELNHSRLRLRDPRIKAVVAINPLGKLFGQAGMNSIQIPTMLISGTHDLITPPVAEQIRPFVWLNDDLDKYLVLVKPGTHFSFLQEGLGILPVPDTLVGPSPTSAYPLIKAVSTAFFRVHLARQSEYQIYLQSDRASQLSNDTFELSIIRSLTKTRLREIINN